MQRLQRVAAHLAAAAEDSRRVAASATLVAEADVSSGRSRLLSEDELARFAADGFIVVHGLFAPNELQPLRDIVGTWLGEVAEELVQLGALSKSFAELDIEDRLARMEEQVPGCALHMQNAFMRDRKLGEDSVWGLPQLRTFRSDPRLLDIFEPILGSEIAAHPNVVLRCRTPTPSRGSDGGRVPWHQDAGYLMQDAVETTVLGVWIPLCDVTSEQNNGCIEFAPCNGSHEPRHVLQHYQAPSYLVVDPTEFDRHFTRQPVICDVPCGSFVLFTSFAAHRSLPNNTRKARFSFDMRYQDARLPHGMGKNGGLVQLRSASPAFEVDWREGPLGEVLLDEVGAPVPQWPRVGSDFTPETHDQLREQIPQASELLSRVRSSRRGGVRAAVQRG